MFALEHFKVHYRTLVVRSLIIITNLFIFFLYTALKLFTVATAMLKNFALSKEKIYNKFHVRPIKERTTRIQSQGLIVLSFF